MARRKAAAIDKEDVPIEEHEKNHGGEISFMYANCFNPGKVDGFEKTNISHILFGIGGSVNLWNKRIHYIELWWKPSITRGFVWFDHKPFSNMTWTETLPQYKVSKDTSRFNYTCWYGSRSAIRMARIVKETFELGLENIRWFVMGDDDTVFFTDNLVTVLAKYNHNQMYYIGANSESVEQDMEHSYATAYGGAGFAISYPLAVELVRILDGCINRYHEFYGSDSKIQGCLSEIGVPLTKELGFHQMDIRGLPYGLLAAHPVAPLVSLHHLDDVLPIFPSQTRMESLKRLISGYEVDPGRTLQHSFCYDLRRNWSVSVSWGYTVMLYPSLVTAKKLETAFQTFQTWGSRHGGPFTFNTRTVSSDPCEIPLVYLLDRVESVGGDETLTTYNRYLPWWNNQGECRHCDCTPALAVEFFNVSASKFSPDLWNKAPRRQCCEIINGSDGVNSMVQVQIRDCMHFESVTPP
ncbi:uncharacterized protein LOC112194128 [Rosa chinensis]|uniref:uncharacterized protein LOC112194128 n=1 Tax=Rosa chinensis TaxID=74649 RepID=UPI000D08DEE8|nr:uncharacterized protein LOC112194128 [Rosa chinensis]